MAIIAALGYPAAIVLPQSDAMGLKLVKLSISISIIMSFLATSIFFFYGESLLLLLNVEQISRFLFFIPLTMLAMAINTILVQWLIRKKAFNITARYTALTAVIVNFAKVGLGSLQQTASILIIVQLGGSLIGSASMFLSWKKSNRRRPSITNDTTHTISYTALAQQYSDFPLLRTPQNIINAISQSLPFLLLSAYFGTNEAGQYALAVSVLNVPITLIGNSVMTVFYPLINETIRNNNNPRPLIIKTTLAMALSGLLPFLLISLFGPVLFSFIFGKEWEISGIYAQILSVWLFLQYINKPAVSAVPSLRLQGGLLIYEFFSTLTKIFALWIGFFFYQNAIVSITLFSLSGSIAYIFLIIWIVSKSNKFIINNHA